MFPLLAIKLHVLLQEWLSGLTGRKLDFKKIRRLLELGIS